MEDTRLFFIIAYLVFAAFILGFGLYLIHQKANPYASFLAQDLKITFNSLLSVEGEATVYYPLKKNEDVDLVIGEGYFDLIYKKSKQRYYFISNTASTLEVQDSPGQLKIIKKRKP